VLCGMPLRLEIKKKLSARSDRVKCVDLHPQEPWVLSALYSGNVYIWDTETSSLLKSWEVCELPVRSCKFIVRRSHFICASDDMRLRIYNYNTMEKVKDVEAHADYIRYVEIHPSQSLVLSSSDDMSIKLWNWEQNWECTSTFEGHAHYVMMTRFNCKDANVFASASLDRSIKVWGLGASQPHFSLEGHDRGVNCIDYYPGGDKPYLISGADDRTIKIWDYQTKSCIQTLGGHTNNVCSVLFHPRLPVLVSASEDGTVRIWHSTTYRLETTLNYGLERAWSISASNESNGLAIGYDEGTILIKLGHDAPVASLDSHTGKLVWAVNNDVHAASLRGLRADLSDGERLPLVIKDMGSCEVFPQSLQHNCNGRFLVVCGDGEYIIYTSQALRNKSFGQALDFAWSAVGTGDYAIRESLSRIRIFKNFKETKTLKVPLAASEGLFGGACLAVRGNDCVCFFDWNDGLFLCKIDVCPSAVYWNETRELVVLVCDELSYILKYDGDLVDSSVAGGDVSPEIGVVGAFEPMFELTERVTGGQWVGDCFLFTSLSGRLNYCVGGNTINLCHLDGVGLYMLGYLPKENSVYLMDRAHSVVSYKALLTVFQYQTAVVRQDFEAANALLPSLPESELSVVAKFLEQQGFKEVALQVSRDTDHKFDLALELDQLDTARSLLENALEKDKDTREYNMKWKRLGDLALSKGDLPLAEKCAFNADDFAGLLMIHTCMGNREGVTKLAKLAESAGRMNIAFISSFILGHLEDCYELLLQADRIPEAAMLARTYLPSKISHAVQLWRQDLARVSERAATTLADPAEYPNLFPELDWALKVEGMFQEKETLISAIKYTQVQGDMDLDLVTLIKQQNEHRSSVTPNNDCSSVSLGEVTSVGQDGVVDQSGDVASLLDDAANATTSTTSVPQTRVERDFVDSSVQEEADAILNDDFEDDDGDDDW